MDSTLILLIFFIIFPAILSLFVYGKYLNKKKVEKFISLKYDQYSILSITSVKSDSKKTRTHPYQFEVTLVNKKDKSIKTVFAFTGLGSEVFIQEDSQ